MIHTLIGTSTASLPTGLPTQHRLFRVSQGAFAGRLLALLARTPTNLAWSYADPPYTSWLDPADFVTESADQPFAAVMNDDADVYVAYTQQGTEALRCVKLAFANGTWATQTPATVYDSAISANRFPSVLKDAYGRLWIAWTRDDAGIYSVRVKSSSDGGQTFGAGPTDSGTDLSGSTTSCYGLLATRADFIHCLFIVGGTVLKNRDIQLDASLWNSAVTLYTGTGMGSDLAADVSHAGMLGVLFAADGELFLKEYDGSAWGALQTAFAQAVSSPALRYVGGAPYALFLQSVGTDQNRLYETHRVGTSFAVPTPVLGQLAPFATVFCLDVDDGVPYADVTAAAASSGGADVFHPVSGALAAAAGDAIFLGSEDRFSMARILLSTVGAGGAVTWSYWNGSEWKDFTPYSGMYAFDSANSAVRFFADTAHAPADWQKSIVNAAGRYWIRAVVTGPFTTAPVGSQVTAVAETHGVSLCGNQL